MARIKIAEKNPICYDIFISCKSDDYEYGNKLYSFLLENNVKAFLADKKLRELGISDYGKIIDDALEHSTHLVVVASSVSHVEEDTSPYVYYEWKTFSEEKRSGRKKGNIMTIVTRKEITNELPIALRNNESFLVDDYAKIVCYIKRENTDTFMPNNSVLAGINLNSYFSSPIISSNIDISARKVGCLFTLFVCLSIFAFLLFSPKSFWVKNFNKEEVQMSNKVQYNSVDLGLPSGTIWCDRNVGSPTIYSYGDLFAWGETDTKAVYKEENYRVKSVSSMSIRFAKLDAANVILGDDWCLPTEENFKELFNSCTWVWFESDSICGYRVVGPNNNELFFPSNGCLSNSLREGYGYYWTSELVSLDKKLAREFWFNKDRMEIGDGLCFRGQGIRAVKTN